MKDLLIIIQTFTLVTLTIYYIYVLIRFGENDYNTKREFLFALLPYGDVIKAGIKNWKKLD